MNEMNKFNHLILKDAQVRGLDEAEASDIFLALQDLHELMIQTQAQMRLDLEDYEDIVGHLASWFVDRRPDHIEAVRAHLQSASRRAHEQQRLGNLAEEVKKRAAKIEQRRENLIKGGSVLPPPVPDPLAPPTADELRELAAAIEGNEKGRVLDS